MRCSYVLVLHFMCSIMFFMDCLFYLFWLAMLDVFFIRLIIVCIMLIINFHNFCGLMILLGIISLMILLGCSFFMLSTGLLEPLQPQHMEILLLLLLLMWSTIFSVYTLKDSSLAST